MLTLHLNAVKERKPRAVVAKYKIPNGDPNFTEGDLEGDWFRVFPATAADIRYLQSLEQHVDKFAPADGGGVLVHPRALPTRFIPLTVKVN